MSKDIIDDRHKPIIEAIRQGDVDALQSMDVSILDEEQRFMAVFSGFQHTRLVEYMLHNHWSEILDNSHFWVLKSLNRHPLSLIEQLCAFANEPLDQSLVHAVKGNRSDLVQLVEILLPYSDPKTSNSKPLQWASVNRNAEALDLLYPLSDPLVALEALQQISTDAQDWLLLFDRIEAERLNSILQHHVGGTSIARERKI